MTFDPLSVEVQVERVIRRSEVMAVVRALRSNAVPRVGDTLDYSIEAPASDQRGCAFAEPRTKRAKPYRFAIEQWHLEAARSLLSPSAPNRGSSGLSRRRQAVDHVAI